MKLLKTLALVASFGFLLTNANAQSSPTSPTINSNAHLQSPIASISPEKRFEIEKMLRLTGMEKRMEQMKVQMLNGMKKQMTDMPNAFWDKLGQKMEYRKMINMIMPIYDKYFAVEDLKAVNAFYESPAGVRMISVTPMMSQEVLKVTMEWGADIGKQAAAEIEQDEKLKQKNQ